MSEFVFLSKIFKILYKEGVVEPSPSFKPPKDLKKMLDLYIDDEGIGDDEIDDVFKDVVKYSLKNNQKCFQNELYGGYDAYSLASGWVTDALSSCQFTFEAFPILTLIENYMIQKFLEFFEFPSFGGGVFCEGNSEANMYALTMARKRYSSKENLHQRSKLIAYTSEDGKHCVGNAGNWLGFGLSNFVVVNCTSNGTMCLYDLEKKIQSDIKNGNIPFFVNATAGTTSLGAIDDIKSIAEICEKYKMWLHIDATLGGHMKLSKKYTKSLEFKSADSLVFAPQKSLGTGLECSLFLIKDKALLSSLDYHFQEDISVDSTDKNNNCPKNVDSLKLWMLFKTRGISGVERMINTSFDCAKYCMDSILKRSGFRLVIPEFQYTNICFWYVPSKLRYRVENEEWWENIFETAKDIKESMDLTGQLVLSCESLPQRQIGHYLRILIKCCPPMDFSTIDYIIEQIEWFGENTSISTSEVWKIQIQTSSH